MAQGVWLVALVDEGLAGTIAEVARKEDVPMSVLSVSPD